MGKDAKGHGSEGSKAAKIDKSDSRIVKRAERLTAWDKRVNEGYGYERNKPIGVSKYAKKPRNT